MNWAVGQKFHIFYFVNHGFTGHISCIRMYVCVYSVCTSYMHSIILLQVSDMYRGRKVCEI